LESERDTSHIPRGKKSLSSLVLKNLDLIYANPLA